MESIEARLIPIVIDSTSQTSFDKGVNIVFRSKASLMFDVSGNSHRRPQTGIEPDKLWQNLDPSVKTLRLPYKSPWHLVDVRSPSCG